MRQLDASKYIFTSEIYHEEFKDILSKMILSYKLMLQNETSLTRNENKIRDILVVDYLKNNKIRNAIGLTSYTFEREVMEDYNIGRIDIKITSTNSLSDTSEYYNCECKLLDSKNTNGISGLNAKYIANGICRFTSGYYHTSTNNVNGMIGFIIDQMDITANISKINCLQNETLKNSKGDPVSANVISRMVKTDFIPDFEHQYMSIHSINNENNITLYHLMMDFSKNINDIVS